MSIFVPIFTILSLLAGGYLAKKIGFLKKKQGRVFLEFAVFFALPCLIFERTYFLNFDPLFIVYILMGFSSCFLAGLFSVALGKLFGFSRATLVSMFLLSTFGNTLVGIAIAQALFNSPQAISEVIFFDALATTIPMALFAPFVLSLASQQRVSFMENVKKMFVFPPFVALVLGFLCKMIELPQFIFEPLRLFGSISTPVALFAIGLGLNFKAIKKSCTSTFIVVFSKMLLAPLIFFLFLKLFEFELSPSAIVLIIQSSMPATTLTSALIIKARLDTNIAVSAIAFGILFTFVSVPLLMWFLN
ncbi:AEC family transporter [Campylobacter troglodytis]|uniref:AEC family transporter n=1 Tax=Campylobacter troglodytis TaxID=654363 RepID=UPI00115765BC|nr:AEC family transporter [Campylobacter troglodytis]TQR60838.1 AEC family transporter [Campylobacter troglodytis]